MSPRSEMIIKNSVFMHLYQLIWLSGSISASGPADCGFKSRSLPKVIVTLTDHTVPSDQDFK